jgi:GT2 family glycosyltransferase
MTTASVIIATYNRAELLDDCLRHLALQDFAPGDEVLIADNGSTDHTADVVARHAARFPASLSRLMVTIPGKSHAVAGALRVASGDIVALTDDDVNVGSGWLTTLKQVLADPATGLAGGPVAPRWQQQAPKWLQIAGQQRLGAPLGLLDYGDNAAPLGSRTLLGANMAVRRQVLEEVGGYATHLGKLRGTLLSGEDQDLCVRVQSAGYGARYVPSARVTHWVPAERMRLSYFLRWFYWSGITNATMQSGQTVAGGFKRVPGWLIRQFAGGIAAAVGCALIGRPAAAVDGALDSAFAVGYAASRFGLVHVSAQATPSIARSV